MKQNLVVLTQWYVFVVLHLLANRDDPTCDRRNFRSVRQSDPPFVSRFGSSLRTRTRAPIGSI